LKIFFKSIISQHNHLKVDLIFLKCLLNSKSCIFTHISWNHSWNIYLLILKSIHLLTSILWDYNITRDLMLHKFCESKMIRWSWLNSSPLYLFNLFVNLCANCNTKKNSRSPRKILTFESLYAFHFFELTKALKLSPHLTRLVSL